MRRDNRFLRTLVCGSLAAVVVTLAGSGVQGQAGISVTFPSRLAAGPDFATDVLGDPWDMCNAEDISPFPMELAGFSNFTYPSPSSCRAGGTTTTTDSNVVFLYRGVHAAVNPGRNGLNFPVDSSKYQVLSYKLSSNLAGQGPQLYWFHNPHGHPGGDAMGVRYAPVATIAGTQIVTADLTQAMVAGGVPWNSGQVRGIRIDPNHSQAGQNAFFDWVRLTTATAIQRITWSGGTGTSTITVRDNGDGTVLSVASVPSAGFYDWNYGVLPPGSYTLTVSRGAASGSAAFAINHPPTIQVTDPSATTGEDYATKVLGNPWDMSDSGDLQITGIEHTVSPPSFSGGQASATNSTGDPNVTLLYPSNNSVPIDSSKYRYLTYRFQVDGQFGLDAAAGSIARVLWSSQNYLNGPSTTTTTDILVWPGMNTYTLDLASLSTASGGGLETSGAAEAWTASVKRNLRFDPHEGSTQRAFHIDDVKLTAKPVAAGSFTIRFAGGDANGDPTTVALYYDTDTNPTNGKTAIASGLAISGGQFGWNTSGVPAGDYYIYAEANDGLQTTGRYSTVPVEVSGLTVVAKPRPGDFDGDRRTDLAVFRPSDGSWSIKHSGSGYTTWTIGQWGMSGDVPVPGDYDGDWRTDIAVYRPSERNWYILKSSTNYTTWLIFQWGISGDLPVPGDYDGDGRTDIAVYRPSNGTWYYTKSSTGYSTWVAYQWGLSADKPVPGDYDGDGKTDMAVYRPSNGLWSLSLSSMNNTTWIIKQWGMPADKPVPGDYDGDGKTDLAVYRPSDGKWNIMYSRTGYTTWMIKQWGMSGDVPVPGDYDGDGKTDMVIYRPSNGTWSILISSTNNTTWYISSRWGMSGDVPVVQ